MEPLYRGWVAKSHPLTMDGRCRPRMGLYVVYAHSATIVTLAVLAVCALVGFLVRELTTSDPILDLTVFTDRNFATGATLSSIVGFGMFSGMLLVAIFTQKLLGYDAWTSGLVLAPGGLGNVFSLFASGIVTRVDQRLMLAFGCLLNAVSLYMTSLTLGIDYRALALTRFIQGFAVRFIFVPRSTLTLATIQRNKLVNATAVCSMARNFGGSVGIAVVTTLLAQRSFLLRHRPALSFLLRHRPALSRGGRPRIIATMRRSGRASSPPRHDQAAHDRHHDTIGCRPHRH
jgi:hypothetical protein